MLTARHHTGRVIELRFVFPYTNEEIRNVGLDIARIFQAVPQPMVGICDMRRADLIPQDQVNLFIPILRNDNPRVERSAFLIKPGAIFGMQVERVLREGGNPNRRAFLDEPSALAWLGEALTAPELERVKAFLAEGEVQSAA